MSLENRYKFLKRMYPNKLILINYDKKIVSCFFDKKILEYLKYDLNKIKKANISYILLDELEVIDKNYYKNNKYLIYKKKTIIKEMLKKAYS